MAEAKLKVNEIDLEALKAALREELMAELKGTAEKSISSDEGSAAEAERAQREYLEEKVTIELFLGGEEFKDDVFVSLNDYTALIKRGVPVQVPRKVALQLAENRAQEIKTMKMIEGLVKEHQTAQSSYNV